MRASLFLLIAALLISGCSGRDKFKDKAALLALAGPVQGSVKDQETTTQWSLLNVRRVNVTACLVEQAMARSVGARSWVVQGPGLDTDAESTSQGCLTWVERLDFEPSARPGYVPVKRTLRSKDGKYQSLEISFALNPWSGLNGDEPVVADPSYEEPAYLAGEVDAGKWLQGIQRSGSLAISRVRHKLVAQPRLALDLRFAPELHTWTMSGANQILPIESGRLEIKVQIAYRPEPRAALVPLHSEIKVPARNFRDGIVDIKGLAIRGLAETDKSKGTYHLLLSIKPVDAPAGLNPFSGVIDLGDWAHLRGGDNPANDTSAPAIEPLAPMGPAGKGFSLGMVQGSTYGPSDENTVYRRVHITMRLNVFGASLGDSLEGEQFEISALDDPSQKIRRNVLEGELSWEDSIVHNYYAPMSTPLSRDIVFTRLETGEKITKRVDLLPWLRFLLVITDQGNDNESVTGQPAPLHGPLTDRRPQIRLEFPCASPGDVRYSVDPETLELKLNVQPFFQFSPAVRRFDEAFWGMATFDGPGLRAGYYQLALAIYNLDRADLSAPVAVTKKIVHHLGGNLSTQVSFNTKDLSLTRLRNYVVAQISLMDPNSLKDAAGAAVDPIRAFKENLPVVSGRVIPSKDLSVRMPLNVFPLILNGDACSANTNPNNMDNPELRRVADLIRQADLDIGALADQVKAAPPGVPDPNGWQGAAKAWGLESIELKAANDIRKVGYDRDWSMAEVESGLECAFQATEQDPKMPAKCLYQSDPNPMWELCRAVSVKWYEMVSSALDSKHGTSRFRPETFIAPTFFSKCIRETRNYMKVRKYVHVTELAKSDDVEIVGGSVPLNVILRTAFQVGTDHGSEFMHEDLNRAALAVKAKGNMTSVLTALMSIFVATPNGQERATANLERALKEYLDKKGVAAAPSANVTVKAQKAKDSFRWIFNYQIPYEYAGLFSSTSLTLENLDIALDVNRHRTCYVIEPQLEKEWEDLLIDIPYDQAPVPRMYVCLPEKSEPRRLLERYFYVYNNSPAGQGSLVDTDRGANRWLLAFRGERDYAVFMRNIRPHIQSFYKDTAEAQVPIEATIDSIRESLYMDKTMYPAAVSAPAPSAEAYDSLENLEGFVPKVLRWLSETFSPLEDNRAPVITDQNSEDTRHYRTN